MYWLIAKYLKVWLKTNLSASDVVRGACFPVTGSIGEVALYTTKMEQAMIVGITFAMKINTALKVICVRKIFVWKITD